MNNSIRSSLAMNNGRTDQVMAAQDAGRLGRLCDALHHGDRSARCARVFYGVQNDDGAWQVSRTSQASAAAELGIEPGDVMLSVGVRRSAASCSSAISSEPVG